MSACVGKYVDFFAPAIVLQALPVASHRCQTKDVLIGASPWKLPMFAVSWRPATAVPPTAGAVPTDGLKCCLSTTGNVWFVIAVSEPDGFAPVIHTRSEKPMSATAGVYVFAVAPAIATQLAGSPTGLQRRQEYVNAIGVEPVQTPALSVSGESTTGELSEICGVDVTFGAIATTTAVDSEFCEA